MRRTVISRTAAAAVVCLLTSPAFAQKDPDVRGGVNNTGGGLQFQGIPIPQAAAANIGEAIFTRLFETFADPNFSLAKTTKAQDNLSTRLLVLRVWRCSFSM